MNNVVPVRDIGLKKAKQKQISGNSQFQQLFNFVPVPLCFADKKGIIIDINDRFIQTFGYFQEDIPTLYEFWIYACPDPDYRQYAVDTWDAVMKRSFDKQIDSEPAEFRITCKNRDLRFINISGTMIGNNFLAAFFDITETRHCEEKLNQQQQELKRWYDVTIEREKRVYDLKHEVNQLLGRLNKPARYSEQNEETNVRDPVDKKRKKT